MTGTEIRKDALRYAAMDGYNLTDPTTIDYINAAVEIVVINYDELGKKVTQEYNITDTTVSTWIDLPTDFLVEKRTYYTDDKSRLIDAASEPNSYLIENGQIRFDFAGDYTMEYVRVPDAITSITNTPNIPSIYHRGLSYYVASRAKGEVFGDEEGEKNELMAKFMSYIQDAYARLNTRKKRRRVKAPQWI